MKDEQRALLQKSPVSNKSGALGVVTLMAGLFFPPSLAAQAPLQPHSTAVVDMGAIAASRLNQTLGVGIAPGGFRQDWEFAAAKQMGASWVRLQCSWQSVEQQTDAPRNQPASTRYVQVPACTSALNSAAKYGLHVTETAAYGPPYHLLLFASLPHGAQVGQTSLQIAFAGGVNGSTLANMQPLYDYICPAVLDDGGSAGKMYRCQGGIGSHGSPPGTLITAVHMTDSSHATIALASAVAGALPGNVQSPQQCSMQAGSNVLSCADGNFDASWAGGIQVSVPGAGPRGVLMTVSSAVESGTQLKLKVNAAKSVSNVAITANRVYAIGEILYPSTGTDRPNDPSVQAYADYATFLAGDMASHGVSGDIEIWNEPPWKGDSWDFRPNLYDGANSGPFKANQGYPKGAAATSNGTLYVSLVDHNQGNEPSRSPRFWSNNVPSTIFPGDPISGANYGFAANLQHRQFPPGVTATWNGTSGNGLSSLLGPQMQMYSGESLIEPPTVVTRESFHPYGGSFNNPEDMLMRPDCLRSAARVAGNIFKNGQDCYLPGERGGANLLQAGG